MEILVFNCGSSSLKFDLIETASDGGGHHTVTHGEVEGIGGQADFHFVDGNGQVSEESQSAPDHAVAAAHVIRWLESTLGKLASRLSAVAHRVVHGGEEITGPTIVDAGVIAAIERNAELAPLHNPAALATIRAVAKMLGPSVPAIVLADTSFHRTLPPHARTYAIPRELSARHGIRRFGFHGIGHACMMERCAELTAIPVTKLNLVTLHLGAGCSVAAISGGQSIDTSMGLTPLE